MSENFVEVTIKRGISKYDINCMLCTAFEGGIGYWCDKAIVPEEGKALIKDKKVEAYYEVISEGIPLTLIHNDDEKVVLDLKGFTKGLQTFAEKHPKRAGDLDAGDLDADDIDCVVQYGVFGEIVYG